MESEQFDALAARLSARLTRRRSLGALGLLGVAGAGLTSEVDGKKKKKKGKRKGKKRKGTPTQPPTTPPTTSGPQSTFLCIAEEFTVSSDIAGTTRTAQTFFATRSGALQRINFPIGKPAGTTGDYLVQLLLVIGNTPSHLPENVLAEVIVPNGAVPEGMNSGVTATFTNGPQLTAGTQYAVAVSRPGPSTYDRASSDVVNCTGRMFVALEGQPFVAQGAQTDAIVRVVVQ